MTDAQVRAFSRTDEILDELVTITREDDGELLTTPELAEVMATGPHGVTDDADLIRSLAALLATAVQRLAYE
jgi:hypothetical protein